MLFYTWESSAWPTLQAKCFLTAGTSANYYALYELDQVRQQQGEVLAVRSNNSPGQKLRALF